MAKDGMELELAVLRRTMVARLLDSSGHPEVANALRGPLQDEELDGKRWGKPPQAKTAILNAVTFVTKMMLGSYIEDIISRPMAKYKPKVGESFMQWSVRAGVHAPSDYFIKEMPLNQDLKWQLLSTELKYFGWDLDSVQRFKKFERQSATG